MIQNLARPMSLLVPAAILSAVPVLVVLFRRGRMPALYLVSAALLFFMGALLITLLVNVPIDRQIEQWTVATLPPDWEGVRDRWQHYHTLRTFISLAGLGLALAGLAVSNRSSVRGATTG
jgi:uncharacterized membrane protein